MMRARRLRHGARRRRSKVYEAAGIGPEDVDVVELHDCFAQNELITYEALGLCPEGEAEKFVCDGDNTYGGKVVTNPSGGLLSKGHPLGATGLAQCYELSQQLRGTAEQRQVEGATRRAAAQSRPRRRLRRHALQCRIERWSTRRCIGRTYSPYTVDVAADDIRRFARQRSARARPDVRTRPLPRMPRAIGASRFRLRSPSVSRWTWPDPFEWLRELGVDLARRAAWRRRAFAISHRHRRRPATFAARIADVTVRKRPAL